MRPLRRALLLLGLIAAALEASAEDAAVLQEWRGRVVEKPAMLPAFVTGPAELEAVWAALKIPEAPPAIDFRRQILLVAAVRSSVVRMRPQRDDAGNLKRNVVATPDQPAYFSYVVCRISRGGITSVDAVPIFASHGCIGLSASLLAPPSVRAGEAPTFTLRLRNTSKESVSVLDVRGGRREDLRETYFPVEIRRAGKPVEVPRKICDPGPVSAEDYYGLAPGATEEIRLMVSCRDLTALPPGSYEARATIRQVFTPTAEGCETPPVTFEVRK